MTRSKEIVLQEMKILELYFLRNIENNIFFTPEYEASKKINQILDTGNIGFAKVQSIITHFNNVA
jgi:hypothetical protein